MSRAYEEETGGPRTMRSGTFAVARKSAKRLKIERDKRLRAKRRKKVSMLKRALKKCQSALRVARG